VLSSQKKKFKKFFNISKPYVIIMLVLVLVLMINSEKYQLATKLYDVGYTAYGNTILFIKNLYTNVLEKTFNNQSLNDLKLLRENSYLEQKYQRIVFENEMLKKQLKLVNKSNYKYISAWATQTTHLKGENALVISAGEKDGVTVGKVIINEHGIIGRVSKTTENFSVVSLLGNANVKIAGVILPSYQHCIIGGSINQKTNDLNLSIEYLSDVHGINEGDVVISSGKDGNTPFGLQIGVVGKSDSKLFVLSKKQIFDSLIVQAIID
jgi:rod shape-determining protein MreC